MSAGSCSRPGGSPPSLPDPDPGGGGFGVRIPLQLGCGASQPSWVKGEVQSSPIPIPHYTPNTQLERRSGLDWEGQADPACTAAPAVGHSLLPCWSWCGFSSPLQGVWIPLFPGARLALAVIFNHGRWTIVRNSQSTAMERTLTSSLPYSNYLCVLGYVT